MPRKRVTPPPARTHAYLAWALLGGLWLLMAAALISYDPADWPGHQVAPLATQPHNWVGKIGALFAHKVYTMFGPGVWIAMTGALAWLAATAMGRKVSQLALRAIGIVVMAIATSALLSWTIPAQAPFDPPGGLFSLLDRPEGAGGLLSVYINQELGTRFGSLGTAIILVVGFWLGMVLAMDQVVAAIPRALARLAVAVANIRWPKPVLVGGFSRAAGLLRDRTSPAQRDKKPARSRRNRGDPEEPIDEDAGGLGAVESFDPDANHKRTRVLEKDDEYDAEEYEYEEDDAEEVDELEDDELSTGDAPGAYLASKKQFDPEALRAKIKQLPINFSRQADTDAGATLGAAAEPDLTGYQYPGLDLLEESEADFNEEIEGIVRDQAVQLESAMRQYRIEGEVVGIDSGPVITLFEIRLAPGTKVSRINSVSSDLARALRAQNIRVVPNMAGKDTVGIEVPNLKKERVRLKELMTANPNAVQKMALPMFLGKDASGNPLVADLATMPHMLIAGTTGSGKSVCMNSIIMSFMYTKRPNELKLVLVDPKMVEMSMFRDIPHLMCPVVTEMPKATAILEWATTKMDERYELLAEAGVRDIAGYNSLEWEDLKERFSPANEAEEARIPKRLPYLVFVIDELADLMMTNKEVEGYIVRLAQKSRAVGMHLILATQRPQANVVTGLIKSNMPCRVSFKVASSMDSRIVLDQKGAELLLGQGDMLFLSPRTSKLARAQGTLVDDFEIRKAVKFLKTVAQQHFEPQLVQIRGPGAGGLDEDRDPLFDDAVAVVLETNRGSVSLLQRRLTIGYSRASRLIEQMAEAGIIGTYKGSQAREVNISVEEWEALKAQAEADAKAAAPVEEDLVEDVEQDVEEELDDEDADEEEEYEDAEELAEGEEYEYEDVEEEDDEDEEEDAPITRA